MNNNLEVLADPKNHDNLLLAEAVAWLHDMGKCDERHLQQSASDYIGRKPYKYKTEHSHLVGSRNLELLGEFVPLKQLMEDRFGPAAPGTTAVAEVSSTTLWRAASGSVRDGAALAGVHSPALSGHLAKGMCAGEVPS